jgi:hypothetical protein
MVLDDEKIITSADCRREDGEPTFGLLSRVSPTGRYVISTVLPHQRHPCGGVQCGGPVSRDG